MSLIFLQFISNIGTNIMKHTKMPMKISTALGIYRSMAPNPSEYRFGSESYLLVAVHWWTDIFVQAIFTKTF